MLKTYSPNDTYNIHLVRVTFMEGEYSGHIAYEMGGNCRGADLLDNGFLYETSQADIDQYIENDCQFTFHEDGEWFSAVLKNPAGHSLTVSGKDEDMRKMIVCMEIDGIR